MADRNMKAGDTDPPLPLQPTNHNGAPADLTDYDEIQVWIRIPNGHSIACDPANVHVLGDPTTGAAEYRWQEGDTDIPGIYNVEYRITWDDGRVRTYPTVGYRTLEIQPNLAEVEA